MRRSVVRGMLAGIALLLTLGSVTASASEAWVLARDRAGIQVWTRAVPGYPIREFKAVTVVKTSLNGLVALIMDTPRAAEWIYRTNRIDLIKRDDERGYFLIQAYMDFPWPMNNRDAIMEGSVTQDSKGVVTVISRTVKSPVQPVPDGYVRMLDMLGTWQFKPLSDGMVEITMQGRANPGGSIPASVINLLVHETPYKTLQGLRRVIANPDYQKQRFPQIHEVE